jgi:hypothetical protein
LAVPPTAARRAAAALGRTDVDVEAGADAGEEAGASGSSVLDQLKGSTGMAMCATLMPRSAARERKREWEREREREHELERDGALRASAVPPSAASAAVGLAPVAAPSQRRGRLSHALDALASASTSASPATAAAPAPLSPVPPAAPPPYVLVAACFENGSIFVLRAREARETREADAADVAEAAAAARFGCAPPAAAETDDAGGATEAVVVLPVCRDPLLCFALRSDEAGGAAAGAAAFVFIFELDVAAGGGRVTRRVPLAAPGASACALLAREHGGGSERVAFGCWDHTVRVVALDDDGEGTEGVEVLRGHRASVYAVAAGAGGVLASADKDGRVLLWAN